MTTCETLKLTKKFGSNIALDEVSVSFKEGSVVGLIGLNGSGKTTLLRHLTGMILPTSGQCLTFGKQAHQLESPDLERIGFVHQEQRLLEWFTVSQQLDYLSRFFKRWDADLQKRLLRDFDLNPKARIGALSPGNLQKLSVIAGACHRPDFLIMDEPASSMDPIARKAFLALLFELLESENQTVVISSHVLTDIEKVVDHVACLHQGRLIEDMPLDELRESFSEWNLIGATTLPVDVTYSLDCQSYQGGIKLIVRNPTETGQALAKRLGAVWQSRPLNLDEIFPLLVGK